MSTCHLDAVDHARGLPCPPGVPERHFRYTDITSTIQMLVDMVRCSDGRLRGLGRAGDGVRDSGRLESWFSWAPRTKACQATPMLPAAGATAKAVPPGIRFNSALALSALLHALQCDAGFRIGNIGDRLGDRVEFETPLESLEEVSKANLVYDLEDARRFKVGLGFRMGSGVRSRASEEIQGDARV